jgi:hypothetical protein
VNVFKNIAIILLGIIFLISATGVLVYYSHCSCSGIEQVSVYVSPETCEENTTFTMHITRVGKRFVQQKMVAMIAVPILMIADVTPRLLNI